jgi:hypothetical protein
LLFTGLNEQLGGEVANGLEHRVAGFPISAVDHPEKAMVDERRQAVEGGIGVTVAGDLADLVDRGATRKDSQATKEALLI